MLPDSVLQMLTDLARNGQSEPGVTVKRGEDIFTGEAVDYPREWSGVIGQAVAKQQLQVMMASAKARGRRMEHTLIASGIAGVGKTTLATLAAYHAGVGLVKSTGQMTVQDAHKLLKAMSDGDVLFVDEAHLLVQGSRNRADWLLPFLLGEGLLTERGAIEVPDVTLIAATTDVGKLPVTLIGRFMCQPKIEAYTAEEATAIAVNLAERMQVSGLPEDFFWRIAAASNQNPRTMRRILTTLRDIQLAMPGTPDLDLALQWCGLSHDGLDTLAQDIMLILLASEGHTCSVESLQAQLNEPGPLRHAEQTLLQHGFVTITGRGRKLTATGRARAIDLVRERRP